MSFNKQLLIDANTNAIESGNYHNMVALTDEELDHFARSVIDTECYSFAHNANMPVIIHDGISYTMKTVRGPNLEAIIWYVRSRLNHAGYGFYGENGSFDGKPVFIYIVGKTVTNYFDLEEGEWGTAKVVEKTETSYFVRISR